MEVHRGCLVGKPAWRKLSYALGRFGTFWDKTFGRVPQNGTKLFEGFCGRLSAFCTKWGKFEMARTHFVQKYYTGVLTSCSRIEHHTTYQVHVCGAPSWTACCQFGPSVDLAERAFFASSLEGLIILTTMPCCEIPDHPSYPVVSFSITNRSPPRRITSIAAVLNATFLAPCGPQTSTALVATLKLVFDNGWTEVVAQAASEKSAMINMIRVISRSLSFPPGRALYVGFEYSSRCVLMERLASVLTLDFD